MKIIPTGQIMGMEQYGKIKPKAKVDTAQSIGQDEINVSSDATLFSETLKVAKQDLNDRLQGSKIDLSEIKSQIENGTYEVDSEKLADSMLMLTGYYERR